MTKTERFQQMVNVSLGDLANKLADIAERLDRIESAMLKREDLHPSVQKPHSIEEWEQLMAGENAATQRRKSLKQAGGAATQEEPDMDAMIGSPLLKAGEQREGGE